FRRRREQAADRARLGPLGDTVFADTIGGIQSAGRGEQSQLADRHRADLFTLCFHVPFRHGASSRDRPKGESNAGIRTANSRPGTATLSAASLGDLSYCHTFTYTRSTALLRTLQKP